MPKCVPLMSCASAEAGEAAYLTSDEVLAIARLGVDAGCTEALFTLGDAGASPDGAKS